MKFGVIKLIVVAAAPNSTLFLVLSITRGHEIGSAAPKIMSPSTHTPSSALTVTAQTLVMIVDFTGQRLWLHHIMVAGVISMDSKEEKYICNN